MSDFVENELPSEDSTTETSRDPLRAFLHHQKRAVEESIKAVDALLPEGFKTHSKEAGAEFFKSFQVLVDAAAEGLEKVSEELDKNFKRASTASDKGDRPSTTGPNKVKVQVE
jgi:hypothetical protein